LTPIDDTTFGLAPISNVPPCFYLWDWMTSFLLEKGRSKDIPRPNPLKVPRPNLILRHLSPRPPYNACRAAPHFNELPTPLGIYIIYFQTGCTLKKLDLFAGVRTNSRDGGENTSRVWGTSRQSVEIAARSTGDARTQINSKTRTFPASTPL